MVRFGFRVPSLNKRISARTSLKRYVRNNLGLKAPRGWGWLTNPKKDLYYRIYNKTTRVCSSLMDWGLRWWMEVIGAADRAGEWAGTEGWPVEIWCEWRGRRVREASYPVVSQAGLLS